MSTFLFGVSELLVDENRAALAGAVQVALVTIIVSPVLWAFSLPFGDLGLQVRLPDMGLYVAIVAAGFRVWRATHSVAQGKDAPEEEAETKAGPRLMRRLPANCDGHVIRLNVTDHQVKVVTTDGEFSVRLRFGDAIDEMDPVDGYCTHRSHWVARGAVSGWERENGKTYLVLVNGDKVPVSRTYRPGLEEAGLL